MSRTTKDEYHLVIREQIQTNKLFLFYFYRLLIQIGSRKEKLLILAMTEVKDIIFFLYEIIS